MEERWVEIPDTDGKYAVSDLGRVKRLKPGRGTAVGKILKAAPNTAGYLSLTLPDLAGKFKSHQVHVLVASTFIGKCPPGMEVNHKKGLKLDNRASELEYMTRSENTKHAHDLGLIDQRGEKNNNSKISEKTVLELKRLRDEGLTQKELSRRFGLNQGFISRVLSGKRWSHLTGHK